MLFNFDRATSTAAIADNSEQVRPTGTGVPHLSSTKKDDLSDDVTPLEINGGTFGQGYADRATGKFYDGTGKIVVVIDGAFNPTHIYYGSKVIDEACVGTRNADGEFSGNLCSSSAKSYSGFENVVYETGKGTSRYDKKCFYASEDRVCNDFHGTMAAGHIAGQPISDSQVRATGIAPGASLILIKIGNNKGWNYDGIAPAIDFVANTLSAKYPGRIAAISLSTSGRMLSDELMCEEGPGSGVRETSIRAAAKSAYNKNIAVVYSSGNNLDAGKKRPILPHQNRQGVQGCPEYTISAGATNVKNLDSLTFYSESSKRTDLVAPVGSGGGDNGVWTSFVSLSSTAVYENRFVKSGLGTSFAAPQIAGAFAVLRQKYPNASVDEIRQLLRDSGDRVIDDREQGTGIITPRSIILESINDRRTAPAYDYLLNGKVSFPLFAADKSLRLSGIDSAGKYDGTSIVVQGNIADKKFIIPVRDFLHSGTNGFVANQGDGIAYYEFNSTTGSLSDPIIISKDGAIGIAFGAAVTGLPSVGTGKGLILQKTTGEVIMRTVNTDRASVSPPKALLPANDNSQLVGVADINSDGQPDLVTRDKAQGSPLARFGSDQHSQPFSSTATQLSAAPFWKNMTQMWVMDDYVSGKPVLGYTAKANRYMVTFTFTPDGLIDRSNRWTAARWDEGVEVLMAPDSKMDVEP